MRLWIDWKGTSCTVWDSGWIGKVPEVWCGMEWYLICGKSCSNQLRTGSREYRPQDNKFHHVSGMEWLAY
jgi:hypothetical protein